MEVGDIVTLQKKFCLDVQQLYVLSKKDVKSGYDDDDDLCWCDFNPVESDLEIGEFKCWTTKTRPLSHLRKVTEEEILFCLTKKFLEEL